MRLAYRALNASGRVVADTIEADTVTQAIALLHDRGLMVSDLKPAASGSRRSGMRLRLPSPTRRLRHLASFTRQVHVLMKSGATLVNAIAATERQTRDEQWRGALASLKARVEEGASLSDAMGAHPELFDPVARSLISAGESSGKMEEMLSRLSTLAQKQLHLRRQVLGALTYPVLVVVVGCSVMGMLIWVVLPRFAALFEATKVPLPPITQLLVAASEFGRSYWWLCAAVIAAAFAGGWRYVTSPIGRRHLGAAFIKAPAIGRVSRAFYSARIARLLGVLLASHVDLLDALRLSSESAGNHLYRDLLLDARERAAQGQPLSAVLADNELMPPSLCEALKNGEQTGATAELLLTVADFMDEDNDIILKALLNILGPAVLVVLGLMVGFVAVSLFLPLFDLTAASGGGA